MKRHFATMKEDDEMRLDQDSEQDHYEMRESMDFDDGDDGDKPQQQQQQQQPAESLDLSAFTDNMIKMVLSTGMPFKVVVSPYWAAAMAILNPLTRHVTLDVLLGSIGSGAFAGQLRDHFRAELAGVRPVFSVSAEFWTLRDDRGACCSVTVHFVKDGSVREVVADLFSMEEVDDIPGYVAGRLMTLFGGSDIAILGITFDKAPRAFRGYHPGEVVTAASEAMAVPAIGCMARLTSCVASDVLVPRVEDGWPEAAEPLIALIEPVIAKVIELTELALDLEANSGQFRARIKVFETVTPLLRPLPDSWVSLFNAVANLLALRDCMPREGGSIYEWHRSWPSSNPDVEDDGKDGEDWADTGNFDLRTSRAQTRLSVKVQRFKDGKGPTPGSTITPQDWEIMGVISRVMKPLKEFNLALRSRKANIHVPVVGLVGLVEAVRKIRDEYSAAEPVAGGLAVVLCDHLLHRLEVRVGALSDQEAAAFALGGLFVPALRRYIDVREVVRRPAGARKPAEGGGAKAEAEAVIRAFGALNLTSQVNRALGQVFKEMDGDPAPAKWCGYTLPPSILLTPLGQRRDVLEALERYLTAPLMIESAPLPSSEVTNPSAWTKPGALESFWSKALAKSPNDLMANLYHLVAPIRATSTETHYGFSSTRFFEVDDDDDSVSFAEHLGSPDLLRNVFVGASILEPQR